MAHVNKFFSKADKFRVAGKYTDVTIQCEEKCFKCHRLVLAGTCDYFDEIFSSVFQENVLLVDNTISAQTFEQILAFAYTGNMKITCNNVFDILQAGDLLKADGIEDLCVQFLKKEFPVKNILKLFLYACNTNKSSLVDSLTRHLTKHFEFFSETEEFLEIPFNVLMTILSDSFSRPSLQDESLNAIIRWIGHAREDRLQYFDELAKTFPLENISPGFMKLIVKGYITGTDVDTLAQSGNTLSNFEDSIIAKNRQRLWVHVYIKYSKENSMKVFTVESTESCYLSCQISQTENECVQSVAVDNACIYSLKTYRDSSYDDDLNPECTISNKFVMSNSINLQSEMTLSPPPVVLTDFSLCHMQNCGVFVYDAQPFSVKNRGGDPPYQIDEIDSNYSRIHLYNYERDKWFPVPKMNRQVECASVTICGDLLYVIGGNEVGVSLIRSIAQSYDHRSGKWQNLSAAEYFYDRPTCCTHAGKIYVVGEWRAELYDPVADKWRQIELMDSTPTFGRLTSYANRVWAWSLLPNYESSTKKLSVNVFDPMSGKWKISTMIADVGEADVISDVLIFNPLL